MHTYFIQFEAFPTEDLGDFAEYGGAYISCWIRELSSDLARRKATRFIEDRGWKIRTLEEQHVALPSMYEDSESREYYEQAQIDGEVYVYDTWPVAERDEDGIH